MIVGYLSITLKPHAIPNTRTHTPVPELGDVDSSCKLVTRCKAAAAAAASTAVLCVWCCYNILSPQLTQEHQANKASCCQHS